MKKKWLIGIASCIMVVALSFGLAACGDNGGNGKDDALVAQKAIDTLNIMYSGDNESTPSDYKVVGQVTAEGTQCAVKWTITSDVENYSNYVSVSEEMDNESKYTVHITRTTVDVPYKLNASVTVGSETKTTSFNHKVPLPQNAGIDTVNATLDFTDAKNYTRNSNNQVWQANGLKLENNSTQAADYTNPARFYKNTKISIAFTDTTIGILHLDFHCDSDYTYNGTTKYFATCLETDLAAQFPEAEITHDEATHGEEGHVVGLQLTAAVSVFEFTCTSDQIRLNSIDVEGVKIGDETIIASAKASLELEQNVYFIQDTATLPTEYNGATIAWSIKETTTYASVSGSTLTISSLPTEGTETVTLVATISAGSATPDTKEFPITLKPTPELTGEGTADSPYTAADAHKIAALLEEGDYFSKAGEPVRVQVKGYVIDTGTWKSNSSYSNWDNVYISTSEADDNESDNAIMIYRLTPDSTYLKGETDLAVGAKLTVLAYIQNYGGKYELTYIGQTNPTATAYDDSRTQEEKDVSKALAALEDTLTVTEAGEINLPASTITTVTFTWSTENSTYTISGNKLTVSELPATAVTFDATVTATAGAGDTAKTGTKTVKITIKSNTSDEKGSSVDNPYTVADIAEILKGLAHTTSTYYTENGKPKAVYVKGIVTVAGTKQDWGYKNVYIADTAGDIDNDVLVYSFNYGTITAADVTDFKVGDTIIICGYLEVYVSGGNVTEEITSWNENGTYHNVTLEAYAAAGTTTPGGETDPEPDTTNYGTVAAPLSVAEALAIATEQCVNNSDWTNQVVYVKGVALSTPIDNGTYCGQFNLADESNHNTKILVYSVTLNGEPAVVQNDILILYGYITNYSGTIEFSTQTIDGNKVFVNLHSNTRGRSTITLGEHDGATVEGLPTEAQTNGTEVTFTVSPEQGKQIVSVMAGSETLIAQDGSYKFTVLGDVTITITTANEGEELPSTVEIEYKDTSTKNMTGENDAQTIFELDSNIFTITSEKTNSGANHVGLNKAGQIRLYKNQTATLHIQVSSGYEIVSIKVTLDSTTPASIDKLVVVGNENIQGGVDGTYKVNGNKVSLYNSDTEKQIYIKSIVITYKSTASAAASVNLEAPEAMLPGEKH